MKRIFSLALLMVLVPGLLLAQEERRGGEGDRGDRPEGEVHQARPKVRNVRPRPNNVNRGAVRSNVRVNNNVKVRVSPQFKSMGVRSYPKPFARNKILNVSRERSSISFPNRGPGGVSLHANVVSRTNFSNNVVVRNQMTVAMNPTFRAQINVYNNNERVVGNYYWHTGSGFNYCHYYDRWGYHWYGWYMGNSYFWTRWYSNHYWWYDPTYYRWCYWHDGGWWWQDPNSTTIYVYNNGNYVNTAADTGAQNAPAPAANGPSKSFYSKDGSRQVKLVGADAFLYDASGNNAFSAVYLGTNVTDVKFSNSQPPQVMLVLNDGTFESFDAQGNPLNGNNSGNSSSGTMQPPSGGNPPGAPGSGN